MAPESTRAAIHEAVRAHAQAIELDVQMTRDRRVVIFHDDRLERTTNGHGRLADTSYGHVASLDAGSWFGARFAGERVLLVSQALGAIPSRMGLNLELKRTSHGTLFMRRLLPLVRRDRPRGRLLLSSFEPALLRPLRTSRLPYALICRTTPDQSLSLAIRLNCFAWHPLHTLLTQRRIHRAHQAGLRVQAWAVDDLRRARRLIAWGVDGIFTNDPARLRGLAA